MRVLIIDNYDSFVYNIAQYIGELGGTPFVKRNDAVTSAEARRLKPDRIILSPGPGTPAEKRYFGSCQAILRDLSGQVPTLGICLGHQGIIHAFGGRIVRAQRLMHGKTSLIRHDGRGIFRDIPNPLEAARYHSLAADPFRLPECLRPTAYSLDDCEIMGVRHTKYPIEGIQFHPESILTSEGKRILGNFLEGGCRDD
ncbi:aminodeoxychorismate/anthranilate synthase component II [Candidatus Bathyarchaeota archaeon]|nr:aminodeoxychorismate/anthranilate synthase component II [Candidatus Bathyarchaeota archaeon]